VAPPIDSPFVGYDFTAPFRELVSSCGGLPPGSGISPNEKISIHVRVFLNRDGTVAAAPQLSDQQSGLLAQHLPATQNPRGIVGRLPRSTCPVPIEVELARTVEASGSVLATSAKPATRVL
jgi:hypothetical protein